MYYTDCLALLTFAIAFKYSHSIFDVLTDLSVKKEKLQNLLQKLDSKSSHDHGSEWHNPEVVESMSCTAAHICSLASLYQ